MKDKEDREAESSGEEEDNSSDEENGNGEEETEPLPLKFRNYVPRDPVLKKYILPKKDPVNIDAELSEIFSNLQALEDVSTTTSKYVHNETAANHLLIFTNNLTD
jgi:hypothetical protein